MKCLTILNPFSSSCRDFVRILMFTFYKWTVQAKVYFIRIQNFHILDFDNEFVMTHSMQIG